MTDFGRRIALHSSTHEDGASDEIEATGLVGRLNYVDRGDPSSVDFTEATLTADSLWYDMDLSSIIPAGALLAHLIGSVRDDTINKYLQFREKGNSNTLNVLSIKIFTANVYTDLVGFVLLDSDRKCEYRLSDNVFDNILVSVKGWFI